MWAGTRVCALRLASMSRALNAPRAATRSRPLGGSYAEYSVAESLDMVEARGRSPSVGSQKTRAGCSVHGLNLHSCSDVTPPLPCYTSTLRVGDRENSRTSHPRGWPAGRPGGRRLMCFEFLRDAAGRPPPTDVVIFARIVASILGDSSGTVTVP